MKALLRTLLILLIVGGLVAGGVYGYSRYTQAQPVPVQPVGNWLLEYAPNQTYLGGSVISGDSMSLYPDKDLTILEVFVSEGQAVKAGDPLVRYDTTKSMLDLDEKLLNRQKLYDELEGLYKEYRRYAYKAYERTVPTATPTPTPTPKGYQGAEAEGLTVTRLSASQRSGPVIRDVVPVSGNGTEQNPYQFTIVGDDPIPESLLNRMHAEANQLRRTVWAVFSTGSGSLDMCFVPADAENPQGSATVTAYETAWTAPRVATGTAQLMGITPTGKGTMEEPYLYPYVKGTEVSWEFLRYYCHRAASEPRDPQYIYVQLIGSKAGDLMLCLDFTSMGTYTLRLTKTPACTVTFDYDDETGRTSTATVPYGGVYGTLPAPTREDYVFSGWWTQKDSGGNKVNKNNIVTKSHTLYAGWNPLATPTPTATPEGWAEDAEPVYVAPVYGGMSRDERLALVAELGQRIRDGELSYKQLCHDIDILKNTAENGTLVSAVDGVVTKLDLQAKSGDTLLEVRGGSGKGVISCTLGETELQKYPLGTELTGFSYEIGDSVTAVVTYLSPMPVTDSYSNGGNPNSSGYTMLLEVQGNVELPLYSYVEFTSFEPLSSTGAIYLYEAFVREIDGQDCIFVARDGVLRKVQVHTGRRTMEYIELVGSDLGRDDYIAFPYGKNVRDGAPVEITDGAW